MAMSTVGTFTGSVVSINSVQLEDDVITMTIDLSRDTTETVTWGGTSDALGSLKGEGTVETIYNNTSGSPYKTLEDEMFTPTSGGLACVFRPDGTGTGNDEWTMNVKITGLGAGGGGNDVKKGSFKFKADTIAVAVQS